MIWFLLAADEATRDGPTHGPAVYSIEGWPGVIALALIVGWLVWFIYQVVTDR